MNRIAYGQSGNDRKGRHLFNLFDVFIILALAACLAVGIYYGTLKRAEQPEQVMADCTLEIKVSSDRVSGLCAGDVLYDATGSLVLGKVKEIETAPAAALTETDADGGKSYTVMRVSVEMEGVYTGEKVFTVNGKSLRIGDGLSVATAHFYGDSIVVGLTVYRFDGNGGAKDE